ncbi:hypothetical protein FTO70_04965 [Methanosarcina sp. KYL-1]|uniref:hypothetical protein n=1 Tax=Methanosarcina sp. KYL-1 TaxID=2602068 RepID=UPI0021008C4B|nr:hypothetical protein [Methanosarcina sp. KYL-1]MCQ1535047.1 hypothetical protein [Methanosarcina sp. KYL-1]
MDIGTRIRILLSLLLISQLAAAVSAGDVVEVWDHYNVTIRTDSETARIIEELTIKNVIDKPVVPGYGYISLSRDQGPTYLGLSLPFNKEEPKALKVRDVSARLDDGSLITDVLVTEEEDGTTVRYGFWTPIMPGQSRTIIIEYTSDDIVDKGLLFDRISYTVQPSSIPIENARIQADLGGDRHISYSSVPPASVGDRVTWERSGLKNEAWQLDFEYSALPLPHSPVHWADMSLGLLFGIIGLWSYRQWKVR